MCLGRVVRGKGLEALLDPSEPLLEGSNVNLTDSVDLRSTFDLGVKDDNSYNGAPSRIRTGTH